MIIRATDLVKKFEQSPALNKLNTQINHASVYGLIGTNGSGKSTFLRLICGVYQPDQGKIEIDGEPIYENVALKSRIYFVSDDLYFLPQANLLDMAKFYKGIYTRFSDETFQKLCGVFPLNPKNKIHTFSKGMKRQAALILGISCSPDILLLDEAFDGLDPVIRSAVKRILSDDVAARDMTVVITSHNLRELEDFCDHIGLLHSGKLMFERDIDELKLGFCKIQAAFKEPPAADAFSELCLLKTTQIGSVFNLVVRGASDDSCAYLRSLGALFAEAIPLTLEEIFIYEMEAVGYDYNNVVF